MFFQVGTRISFSLLFPLSSTPSFAFFFRPPIPDNYKFNVVSVAIVIGSSLCDTHCSVCSVGLQLCAVWCANYTDTCVWHRRVLSPAGSQQSLCHTPMERNGGGATETYLKGLSVEPLASETKFRGYGGCLTDLKSDAVEVQVIPPVCETDLMNDLSVGSFVADLAAEENKFEELRKTLRPRPRQV